MDSEAGPRREADMPRWRFFGMTTVRETGHFGGSTEVHRWARVTADKEDT